MKIQLLSKKPLGADFIALPVFEGEKVDFEESVVKEFLKDNPKFGKLFETQLLYCLGVKVLLVGIGKKDKFNFEVCQNWAGSVVKSLLNKGQGVVLLAPTSESLPIAQTVYALSLGMEIATHDPSVKYKSETEPTKLKVGQIWVEKSSPSLQAALQKAKILAEAINSARTLGDMPANEMTPSYFLSVARRVALENKLKLQVIDEKKAKKMGMGAFVGVSAGSDEPSYLIALEYQGKRGVKEKWGLVGKGITFDSGGISIKPGEGMHEMKYDMSGAAAVLASIQAIAKMGLKANVVAVCAVTENLPSGKALKPGDIVKTYSGKTAEVLNTDAEGRLVLADALTFAQKDFKVSKIVDLATLTGAMIVALGDFTTGVFSNNEEFAQRLIASGQVVGERFWLMPMDEDYEELIKSEMADMSNIGHGGSSSRAAGSIVGAKFLEKVIEDKRPWIHLDIAGTAWDMKARPFRGAGATGVGIKTLVELVAGS